LRGKRPGKPPARSVILKPANAQGHAVQCIVGFYVVTLTRFDEHVDNADYVLTAASKNISDSALNLFFVDIRAIHTTLIWIGHLIDKSGKGR
jgi:hypothetical protein